LDPACGTGRFLVSALERIIANSPPEDLKKNVEMLQGWDIDEVALQTCREILDKKLAPTGIQANWQLKVMDSLEEGRQEAYQNAFDCIVANPPYIRIQHLPENKRNFIQENYRFCSKGSTDVFIAFFELSLGLLAPKGQAGFITPNSFLYSETARALRNHFSAQQILRQITNYAEQAVFKGVGTYSAITIFGKEKQASFTYQKANSLQQFQKERVFFSDLQEANVWRLGLRKNSFSQGVALKEIADIRVGLTTLQDRSFIFKGKPLNAEQVEVATPMGSIPLEKAILKNIIKASKPSRYTDYLLFPYQIKEDKAHILPEDVLQDKFPRAYQYLCQMKAQLDKRDNGKSNRVAWYAFGRHQSLATGFGPKIFFSPMNKAPNFIYSDRAKTTIYSGYFIKLKETPSAARYQNLLKQLNSQKMADYVAASSRDFRGGWKAYSKRVIEDFIIDPKLL
ncbi:MAG: N-6 DNA methylase, partial [Bacteroidota bacterium]